MTIKELVEKHHYRTKDHAAVKICHYTKLAITGRGVCYKQKFYGIKTHRCMQMTPAYAWCTHNCQFCWRPIEESNSLPAPEWKKPEEFMPELILEQIKLLNGFKGDPRCTPDLWDEASRPNQVAISLAGEPTLYPYLPEMIEWCHRNGMTTFLVSNGTQPDMLRKVKPTQLYMTLPAPDVETYKKTCRADLWHKILESIDLFPSINTRRVIRLTLTKGLNMKDPKGYAKLIKRADPDYVEAKAYMHVGFSTYRLPREAMPEHSEVRAFAKGIAKETGYIIADEFEKARVVLLARDEATAAKKIIDGKA